MNKNKHKYERRKQVVSVKRAKLREMPRDIVEPHPTTVLKVDRAKLSAPHATADNPSGSPSYQLIAAAIKGEYSYAKLGLILGLSSIIGGIVLGLNGVAGSTSWTAKVLGLESKINDAAPGVVLFIVGLFMVWVTKPRVKLKDIQD